MYNGQVIWPLLQNMFVSNVAMNLSDGLENVPTVIHGIVWLRQ